MRYLVSVLLVLMSCALKAQTFTSTAGGNIPDGTAAVPKAHTRSSALSMVHVSMKHLSCTFVGIALMLMLAATAQASTTTGFTNGGAITISSTGNATPYPSRINVSGINNFTRIEVTLNNLSHTYPDDIDILLVAPDGRRTILISDAGGEFDLTNQTLTFTPTAAALPDTTQISTGSYRPSNFVDGPLETDTFSAPGPGTLSNALAEFGELTGASANGFWDLYVVDDATGDSGSIAGGWTITFTVPAVFTVTKIDDTNDGVCNADCSLREALALAQNGDLINFSSLFDAPQTINLLTALPAITRSITIQGKGANLTTVRRPSNAATSFRIFDIIGASNGVVISGMTITGGDAGTNFGGGILSESPLTLSNVHVTSNRADNGGGVSLRFAGGVFTNCTFSSNSVTLNGGGIFYQGIQSQSLRLLNSTVSGNRGRNLSGGIFQGANASESRLEVVNSTIADNSSPSGGAVFTVAVGAGTTATTTLRSTIITGNTPNNLFARVESGGGPATFQTLGFNLSDNFNGVFTSLASDITSATPRLAPLALYGGQTPTHALRHASPAINAGDASGASSDQRGAVRVFGTQADIGAVEMRPRVVTNTNDSGAGSLRDVLTLANADVQLNDIQFDNSVFGTATQGITLGGSQLSITTNANVIGPGANLLLISGNNASRVFQINGTATLSGLSIASGNGNGNQDGGGILNQGNLTLTQATLRSNVSTLGGGGILSTPTARLTVSQCAIVDNQASSSGGGLAILGSSTISNSTISGNTANNGGGIFYSAGTSSVISSTIANNTRSGASGASGVTVIGGSTTLRNTIVAANANTATVADVDGASLSSAGFNLIGNRGTVTAFNQSSDQSGTGAAPVNPLLNLQLRMDGGSTTATHSFLAGSPALDKGDRSGATTDQRGLARPVDLASITNISDGADIGAVEAQTVPTDVAPTAVATAFGVTVPGGTEYQFVTDYSDDNAIVVSTIGTGDVSVSGPGGFTVTATFAFVNNNSNGTPRAAVYVFTPPGGSWDSTDNGTYTIAMRANEVSDLTGNFVAAGTLTTFTVNIPSPAAPTVTYNPSASSTINFPAGPAGVATSSIAVTSSGGAAPGSVTINNCTAPSGFTITNAPINLTGTAGGAQINSSIALSCTRGAAAQSGALSCSETPTPGAAVTRIWILSCPAADSGNTPPVLAFNPSAGSTINYNTAGSASGIALTPSGGPARVQRPPLRSAPARSPAAVPPFRPPALRSSALLAPPAQRKTWAYPTARPKVRR